CLLDVFFAVGGLKAGSDAIEQRRRQHLIAFLGEAITLLHDVLGDAEDLLNQYQPAPALADRLDVIDADLASVAHRHADHLPLERHLLAPPSLLKAQK